MKASSRKQFAHFRVLAIRSARRGDIWTVSAGKDDAGKPRPVVIVQDDSFDATDSVTTGCVRHAG